METLSIIGAREGNLRDVTLRIPKNRLVVFTGVSGSGKSTLLVDVLFNECQRLYLEALSLQGIRKPAVERVKGASPAIAILQNDANKNPRSTVGTLTDVYTALRMVYEKLGEYPCPRCGETICAADCLEETERVGDDFHVYMHCSACGERVDKITRTDFSFNTREGACPACEGLGRVLAVDRAAAVDEGKSLEDGAVAFWAAKYQDYQIGVFRAACRHFGLPDLANVPVAAFGELQKALLYEGAEADALARALPHAEPPKMAEGSLADLSAAPDSATGRFLARKPALKRAVRTPDDPPIRIRNATRFNLRHLDVDVPTGRLVTVTGPSGSGKSTLVFEVLAHGNAAGPENAVAGCERFDRIASVGQSPVVRMKRSNVATYIDAYGPIRSAFAGTDAARARGLAAKAFSFNTPGGRCETCEGMGTVANNLLFFLDTEVPCPTCHGQRFHADVLSVRLDSLSIVDVLALSVSEAAAAFADRPKIARPLRLLQDVGLGYLQLGQSLTTLSGGEAQRLKLAKELLTAGRSRTLYLLDEPTSGLHPQDVEHFLALLDRLVDGGNTVVVVEHNQQVVCASDWVVDLGPEGGEAGGRVMFAGTPADLAAHGEGATADCLRKALEAR